MADRQGSDGITAARFTLAAAIIGLAGAIIGNVLPVSLPGSSRPSRVELEDLKAGLARASSERDTLTADLGRIRAQLHESTDGHDKALRDLASAKSELLQCQAEKRVPQSNPPGPGGGTQPSATGLTPPSSAVRTLPVAAGPPTFETDIYSVTVQSLHSRGSAVIAILTFHNLTEKSIRFNWGGVSSRPYLVDEDGRRLPLAHSDSPVVWSFGGSNAQLAPNTKLRTEMIFGGAGEAHGRTFTLVAKEMYPRDGRDIVIPKLVLH